MATVTVKLPRDVAAAILYVLETGERDNVTAVDAAAAAITAALNPSPPTPKTSKAPAKRSRSSLACSTCKARMGHREDCPAAAANRVVLLDTKREWAMLRAAGIDIMRWDAPDTVAEAVRRGMLRHAGDTHAAAHEAALAVQLADAPPPETHSSGATATAADGTPRSDGSDRMQDVAARYVQDRARFKGRRRHNGRLRRRVAS